MLTDGAGATVQQAAACVAFAGISGEPGAGMDAVRQQVDALQVSHPLLAEGLDELTGVVEAADEAVPGVLVADLSIARGLDYYTGTVFETHLVGHESLGSICSGGRYDELAHDGRRAFPGVGISVGVTRLVGALVSRSLVVTDRAVPSVVLVAVVDEAQRSASQQVATLLRRRGIPTEVSPTAAKFGRQIRYADRRAIPYVWFPAAGGQALTAGEVKDIRTGQQGPADPTDWRPPAAELRPRLFSTVPEESS
jgi:histidyl-tRNA synthetase